VTNGEVISCCSSAVGMPGVLVSMCG